jgi:hypothetical protein
LAGVKSFSHLSITILLENSTTAPEQKTFVASLSQSQGIAFPGIAAKQPN